MPSSEELSNNQTAAYAWLYRNNRASELVSFSIINRSSYGLLYRIKLDDNYLRLPNNERGNTDLELLTTDTSKVFYSPGNIEITKNIGVLGNNCRYNISCSNTEDIIQNVIIADGDIIIDENVTRIDTWLIAGGNINTCSINGAAQTSSTIDSDKCTNPLTINGPVHAIAPPIKT